MVPLSSDLEPFELGVGCQAKAVRRCLAVRPRMLRLYGLVNMGPGTISVDEKKKVY